MSDVNIRIARGGAWLVGYNHAKDEAADEINRLRADNADLLQFIESISEMDDEVASRARAVAKSFMRRYAKTKHALDHDPNPDPFLDY